ncbi:VWA domain-containing protein [Paenibacillus hexagrammi]|uniref:VWA domain-containing protein n=1 Tax=Paenibacillus hexagrammi TaxID=2908839 RepID=A0ABY3SPH8_9BACL|nr:VWA domain-containing protein [Paenibacillus sp. YPD9-1]UJF35106.1 VWA domain-containing protein [Paenibacillus sp. YPD9-1]
MLRQGNLLKDLGVPVDVVPIPQRERKDAAVESLQIPDKLFQAEGYTVEVRIRSTFTGGAKLRIYEDHHEMTEQDVELEKGENRFAIKTLAKEPGFHSYKAELYTEGDELSVNNTDYAFSQVEGPPKVLIVEGTEGNSRNIEAALQSALVPYETIQPELLSNELVVYAGYDSIVLNNVPATRIPQAKMDMIERAVRDYSVGLVMLGGEDSYGLGGYFQTPIERALPVYMDLRGKREIPSLGIVLVIDKSGSMSGDKMKLAQEAASRTVDLLRDKDTLGVLGFDSSPVWYVKPQQLANKDEIIGKINSIPADGGTEIYSAVAEAYTQLKNVDAQRKHIILLTDGQSSTNQSYQALAQSMQQQNVTMSTVAIGTDADQTLLKLLAELAKGRYYAAVDETTIPAIFSREAVLISRTYVVNQPFVPSFTGGAEWGNLFGSGVPGLKGYIATTPKETAEVVLSSAEPDPILATWQYGTGRSAAWTSDVTGGWSSDWVAWQRFPAFLTGLIKWTFPQFQSSPLTLTTHVSGNEASLEAEVGDPRFHGDLQAVATDASLQTKELSFIPTAPGTYSTRMPVDKSGVYLLQTKLLDTDNGHGGEPQVVGSATTGVVVPYSPEYRITDGQGLTKLKQLADLTGGRMLSLEHPEEVFAFEPAGQRQEKPISECLLMAALALLLLDIAARRISWPSGLLRRTAAAARARAAGPAVPPGARDARAPVNPPPTCAVVGDALAETPLARLRERQQLASRKLHRPAAVAKPAASAPAAPPSASAPLAPGAAAAQQRPGAGPPQQEGAAQSAPPAAERSAPPDAMSRLLDAKRRNRR